MSKEEMNIRRCFVSDFKENSLNQPYTVYLPFGADAVLFIFTVDRKESIISSFHWILWSLDSVSSCESD